MITESKIQMEKILNLSDKVIEYSYYLIFFLVPLVFWGQTSELFEFNKMWLTFILTIIIATVWIGKMIVLRKIYIQKTPLDIVIAIFLLSQILSSIFSLDSYVSLWGYYSRFNGGLLSIIAYIVLYYAFISNFDLKTKAKTVAKKIIFVSLGSGAIVALWGLPSHFGYDPTCLIFRGSFDVSCWTSDFQPKIRIFSTLGQPDWLGAYLAILTPLLFAIALNTKRRLLVTCYLLLATLFYADLLFTKSRSALLAFWVSIFSLTLLFYFYQFKTKAKEINFKTIWKNFKPVIVVLVVLIALTFAIANPLPAKSGKTAPTQTAGTFSTGGGGTESGKIRLLVWEGAINIWKHYPILGSGVETFAFSYYRYRPAEHNLTSEWNYLYNKAHNEYLNFLATTGIFGLISYLSMIVLFLWISLKRITNYKLQITNLRLVLALIAGYVSILVSNFFGFSVVITNLYLFLIPAFVLVLLESIKTGKLFEYSFGQPQEKLSVLQKLDIFVACLVAIYLLYGLSNFWLADQAYSLGTNLERSGQYDRAFTALQDAVAKAPFEPTYKDELASNDSILAVSILSQLPQDSKKASSEARLAQAVAKEAIVATTEVTGEHPNNVVFWKTKTRVFYTLSQVDPKYLKFALDAIKKAQELAPTDASVSYNIGLLYGQSGDTKKAVQTLEQTVKLKPNYINAHYALGLFYRELATDLKGKVIDQNYEQKAEDQMNLILKMDPNNPDAKQALKLWGNQ